VYEQELAGLPYHPKSCSTPSEGSAAKPSDDIVISATTAAMGSSRSIGPANASADAGLRFAGYGLAPHVT
jgi:hypothetical protein